MQIVKKTSLESAVRLESQDDIGYLTGQRSQAEREKQIRPPRQRETVSREDRDYGRNVNGRSE